MASTVNTKDDKVRCAWVKQKPHFIRYHDEEWGVPVHDDRRHFEMLILEGAQAGLSWETILLRREGYRQAFAGFDPQKVAKFDARKKAALLTNTSIIRNRLKIEAAVTNAQAFLTVQEEWGSFNAYIWTFVGGAPKINHWTDISQVPATSLESEALSKDLKKRGFRFVGSTIIYAHMQAAGLVNDHTTDCFLGPKKRRVKGKGTMPLSSSEKSMTSSTTNSPSPNIPRTKRGTQPAPMNIRVKRVYEAPSKADGFRVLVDRLWPRGLSKEVACLDLWMREVSPSTALRNWFKHEPSQWDEFQRRYAAQLEQHSEEVEKLREYARNGPLTFVYGSRNEKLNNAVALKAYLDRKKW